MAGEVVPLSGGRTVNVDFQNDNLTKVMLVLQLSRAVSINTQLTSDAKAIEERNEILKAANNALAAARDAKQDAQDLEDDDSDEPWTLEPSEYTNFRSTYGVEHDTTGSDNYHTADEWDVNIEYLKTFIDNLNSSSDLDMARLQELTNKHSQSFELLTTFLQKSNQAMEGIVQIR